MSTNPSLRDRETRGIVKSERRFILTEREILALKERAPFEFSDGRRPDVLYTAIDPSGGGQGSDYAVCTMTLFDGRPVVSARSRMLRGRREAMEVAIVVELVEHEGDGVLVAQALGALRVEGLAVAVASVEPL